MHLGVRALWLTLILLCFFIVPRPAGAVGLVLHGDATQVTQVRIAVAPSAARTVRWYSLSTAHAPPIAWVIPTGKNASVSVVSHAWLEALDEASAVRVIPSCGGTAVETHRSVQVGPSPFTPEMDTVTSPEELDAKLGEPDLPADVRSDLTARLATQNLVLVRTKGPHTPVIRVVDPEAGMPVPLSLLRSPRNVEVTAFVVAEKSLMLGTRIGWPSSIHWFGERSDYLLKRDGALAGAVPGAFVVESSPEGGFVRERRAGTSVVPSATMAYLDLAARYGGRADDLELALAQRAPESLRITRLAGRIPAQGALPDLRPTALSFPAPDQVLMAQATCGSPGGGSGGGSNGGSSPPPGRHDSYESAGCSGSSTGGSSGSSRSSGSSSSESCSSDTTDSSSSGEDDSEACNSDTTDSSDSDDDDSSSDDGEGCGADDDGSTSDSEEDQCSTSGAKRRTWKGRSPLSRGVLALAMLVLPLRRLGRRKPPVP